MACTFTCDGCGATAPGYYNGVGQWFKPSAWFARNSKDGKSEILACSRKCIEMADQARGERVAILPI